MKVCFEFFNFSYSLKEKASKISKENQLLYLKITDLDKKPNELSKNFLMRNYRPATSNKSYAIRLKEMKKIKNENKV